MKINVSNKKILEFYTDYNYPQKVDSKSVLNELLNLCKAFERKTGYSFDNKNILDAGTGTGDRIIEVAKNYPNSKITAVDFCQSSLTIAKEKSIAAKLDNIRFIEADLQQLDNLNNESFDVIFSMGVIHHLASPIIGTRNLYNHLKPDGLFFCYLYGEHGGVQRMHKKNILNILANNDSVANKIEIAKQLNYAPSEYGWHDVNEDNSDNLYALLADCFINPNEKLYNITTINELIQKSRFQGFSLFGITTLDAGALFVDIEIHDTSLPLRDRISVTRFDQIKINKDLIKRFLPLSSLKKYELLDHLYQPNGYTVIGWKSQDNTMKNFPDYYKKNSVFSTAI